MTTDLPWRSTDYVHPTDRPTAWARMARDLANAGRTTEQIADALCIDEPTAAALLGPNLLERVS